MISWFQCFVVKSKSHRVWRCLYFYSVAITKTSGKLDRKQYCKGTWERLEGQDKQKGQAKMLDTALFKHTVLKGLVNLGCWALSDAVFWCPCSDVLVRVLLLVPVLMFCSDVLVRVLLLVPVLMFCSDVLFWCSVLMSCSDVLFWCSVLMSCSDVLFWCSVLMFCSDVLFWCSVLMFCSDVLFWCPVLMFCSDVLFWCSVLMSCSDVLFWCSVLMFCSDVLFWCSVLMFWSDVLQLPGKRGEGPKGWSIQAKLNMMIWLGLHKHKKDYLKDAPKGYQTVSPQAGCCCCFFFPSQRSVFSEPFSQTDRSNWDLPSTSWQCIV